MIKLKTPLFVVVLIILILATACEQPEFVTDKSDNIDLTPPQPVPEEVTILDSTQIAQPGGLFSDSWYLLVEDGDHHEIHLAQMTPEGTLQTGAFPLFTFDDAMRPVHIDSSAITGHLLVQTDSTLYSLNLSQADLVELASVPDRTTGKVLQSPYQPDHLFAVLSKPDSAPYLVDTTYTAETVMDLVAAPDASLLDVSEDAARFFFRTQDGMQIVDIARGTDTVVPEEELTVFTVEIGEKIGTVEIVDFSLWPGEPAGDPETVYDTVIHDGIVFEPESQTIKYGYDIGILGDTIARIDAGDLEGLETIDAQGLVVSPGFIDMLSFNPNYIGARYKIADGVTTNLSMHGCTNDYDQFFSNYENHPVMVNYGGAVFMYLIRLEAGLGRYNTPSESQVAYIAERTREEIEAGGLALAFSPEYYPGTTPQEIEAAMTVAAEYGLSTHFHARYSALTGENTGIDSVIEVLGYARDLDAPVHFMHLHSTGGTGVMDEALDMIHEAVDDGLNVSFDIYPYDSWATNIGSARFDGDWQTRFDISYEDLQIAGTYDFVTPETFQRLRDQQRIIVAYAMDDAEVIAALQDPLSMVGSDSIVETDPSFNHFRASGTFSRFLGRYVRDLDIMPLMEGIRKTSYNAAHELEAVSEDMLLRGRLTEGSIADITLFDYASVIDTSSAAIPASESEGIEYVLVSGHLVKDPERVYTDRRYGQPIANDLRQE